MAPIITAICANLFTTPHTCLLHNKPTDSIHYNNEIIMSIKHGTYNNGFNYLPQHTFVYSLEIWIDFICQLWFLSQITKNNLWCDNTATYNVPTM